MSGWLVRWVEDGRATHSCVLPTEDAAQRLVKSFCDSGFEASYRATVEDAVTYDSADVAELIDAAKCARTRLEAHGLPATYLDRALARCGATPKDTGGVL